MKETLGKQVLIKPSDNPEKTQKGILIPKTAGKIKSIGTVISCGGGCIDVREGAKVQYNPKHGSIIPIEGVDHHFILEGQIYYIYGEEENS